MYLLARSCLYIAVMHNISLYCICYCMIITISCTYAYIYIHHHVDSGVGNSTMDLTAVGSPASEYNKYCMCMHGTL